MSRYYFNDPDAPAASSVHLGTAVAIMRGDRVLLDHRRDGQWGLIGGAFEVGESLATCVRREAAEETGLDLADLTLLGTFSDPSRIIDRGGQVVQSVTVCFSATSTAGSVRLSEESREVRFFREADLATLDIVATHAMIVPWLFKQACWPVIE